MDECQVLCYCHNTETFYEQSKCLKELYPSITVFRIDNLLYLHSYFYAVMPLALTYLA